ncbi:MAG: hypothetical protein ACP5QT_01045 [Brevinematia bacterium]
MQIKTKKTIIYILIMAILFLSGALLTGDYLAMKFDFTQNISPIAKITISFLAMLIALLTGKNGISRSDTVMLYIAFPLTFIGDVFVTTSIYWNDASIIFKLGGISFIFSVLVFTIRHSRYFSFLKKPTFFKILPAIVFFLILTFMVVFFYKQLLEKKLFILAIVYGSLVVLFIWAGIAAKFCKLFPKTNANLIFYGSIFFFLMELTGQLFNLKVPFFTAAGFLLSWTFYVPALILIALSGYKFNDSESGK